MAVKAADADERNPGRLPCPGDDTADNFCILQTETKIGRLPWRTLGLPKLLDASGEPLWYVVSPGWANTTIGENLLRINSDSKGNLTVDGQANAAVALIIAPGGPVVTAGSAACPAHTQQRGATPHHCEYLESVLDANPTAPGFVTTGAAGAFNDQVLKITAADLIPALEAAIATRMQRDLAPVLADATQSDGANAVRIAAAPNYYPFSAGWTNPSVSSYAGTIGASQGLLPHVRSRKACDPLTDVGCDANFRSKSCTAGTDLHCDPSTAVLWRAGTSIDESESRNFGLGWTVKWTNGAQVDFDIVSGWPHVIGNVNCSPTNTIPPANDTTALMQCQVSYGRICFFPPCSAVQPTIKVTTRTTNTMGLAFRRANKDGLAAYSAMYPGEAQFQTSSAHNDVQWRSGANLGAARVGTTWLLPLSNYPCNNDNCSSTVIRIPSTYIEDNVVLQSRLRDAPASGQPDPYSWFIRNNWHQVTYFATAPGLVPGGTGACSDISPVSCLQVANVSPANKQRAILVLTGRSLSGATRPNANLNDYLDPDKNCNGNPPPADCARAGNTVFEQRVVNSSFNDRVVVIDANPNP
jgi:hypothetical protein